MEKLIREPHYNWSASEKKAIFEYIFKDIFYSTNIKAFNELNFQYQISKKTDEDFKLLHEACRHWENIRRHFYYYPFAPAEIVESNGVIYAREALLQSQIKIEEDI
jgi:hypothetical protein